MPAVVINTHAGHELDAVSDAVDDGMYSSRRSTAS